MRGNLFLRKRMGKVPRDWGVYKYIFDLTERVGVFLSGARKGEITCHNQEVSKNREML